MDVAHVTTRRNAEPGFIWCAKLVASDGREIGPYVANAATGRATADGRAASQVVIAAAAGTYRIQLGAGRRLADWSVRIDSSSWIRGDGRNEA